MHDLRSPVGYFLLSAVWHWLMSLDATTRAAIIGGSANLLAILAGLLGVYVNLAWNRKQHQDEKSYNLRRDVYLEAVDVISRAVTFLAGKAVPPPDEEKEAAKKKEKEISTDLSGVCAKLHILGTKRVVAATIAFQSVFDEWSNKIGAHRRAAAEGEKRRDDVDKQIEQFRARILAALAPKDDTTRKPTGSAQNTGDQGPLPKPEEDVAKEVQAQLQQKLGSLAKEYMGISVEIFQKLGAAADYLLDVPKALNPLLTELTLAMKSDLGLPSDDGWYKSEMTKALADSLRSNAQLLESIKEDIRKRIAQTSTYEMKIGNTLP